MPDTSNKDQSNDLSLNPTVKKLGAVSFFTDIASEMLYPITPIFLTSVLGASMTSVGLIEGISESISSLLKSYSGFWSDRIFKRKPFIVIGYLLSSISKPLIGISSSWSDVLFARALDRTGKGIRTAPRDALIADSVPPQLRGGAFGWHRSMDTLGAALGPLLTVSLLSTAGEENLRQIYWWALIPGLIAVIIALSIKEPPTLTRIKSAKIQNFSLKEFGPEFKMFLIAWTVFSLANSSDVFLLMKAKESGASMTDVVLLYCAYNFTYAFSAPYLGKLSDSVPKKYLMISGLFVFSLVYLGFSFTSTQWHFWVLFLLYGFYMGATDGVGKALLLDHSPQHLKATAIGIMASLTGFATIFASAFAGWLWDTKGADFAFYFGAVGAVFSMILFVPIKAK